MRAWLTVRRWFTCASCGRPTVNLGAFGHPLTSITKRLVDHVSIPSSWRARIKLQSCRHVCACSKVALRFHVGGAVGGNCDHWHPRCAAIAGNSGGPRIGAAVELLEQPPAAWHRDAEPSCVAKDVPLRPG